MTHLAHTILAACFHVICTDCWQLLYTQAKQTVDILLRTDVVRSEILIGKHTV